jgi:hypothetical protein
MKMSRTSKSKPKRPWQDVAKEAQELRDESLSRVPGINDVFENGIFSGGLPKNVTAIPGLVLNQRDIQITDSLPEELVKILAGGQITATDVTLAFLRRAAVAQRLVGIPQDP